MFPSSAAIWLLLILPMSWLSEASASAVMGVDLGTEFMKVAVVSSDVHMEIALNAESKRKTAVAVAIKDGERFFGSDALAVAIKNPKSCYVNVLDLLGKKFEHPQVSLYRQQHPYYSLKPDPKRGTVLFQHDDNTVYSPEELLAMVLQHAKHIAEDFTHEEVREAVVTIPVYFNQAERRAMAAAVRMAGLNLLQLISEPMAVALSYGMFRSNEFDDNVRRVMFFDMGSRDTVVSIVAFQKADGAIPEARVLGIGYDRNLGASTVQLRLRDHLAEKFNALKKTTTDVRSVPRAMAKLMKEASRVKTVLSANSDAVAQVENVLEDMDLKLPLTRETLHRLNEDFFGGVSRPIEHALLSASLSSRDVDAVVLAGAGTRIPRVQEILERYMRREPSKNLNTDEAAVMGAVYQAARLSRNFRVKEFATTDALLFPIEVQEDGLSRQIFGTMDSVPQNKSMDINSMVSDNFKLRVRMASNVLLSEDERKNLGSTELAEVYVTGISKEFARFAKELFAQSKGATAHFSLDKSGLFNVTSIEAAFETISSEQREITVVNVPLDFTMQAIDVPDLTEALLKESQAKLAALEERDAKKKARDEALNSLETLVVEAREKLHADRFYEQSLPEAEKARVEAKCAELSSWLEDEVTSETATWLLEAKLNELRVLTSPWYARAQEHRTRPEAVQSLERALGAAETLAANARRSVGQEDIGSQIERLESTIREMRAWLDKAVERQEQQPLHESPKLTINELDEKRSALEGEVKSLLKSAIEAKLNIEQDHPAGKGADKSLKAEEDISNPDGVSSWLMRRELL